MLLELYGGKGSHKYKGGMEAENKVKQAVGCPVPVEKHRNRNLAFCPSWVNAERMQSCSSPCTYPGTQAHSLDTASH
jgi:hypothetical protein